MRSVCGGRWLDHRMVIYGRPGGGGRSRFEHRGAGTLTRRSAPSFDAERYKERNTVERCFNKLCQSRAVATRYDKRERTYQGTADVAAIRIWLRDPVV